MSDWHTRVKYRLTDDDLHRGLNLGPDATVVDAWADRDPFVVWVLVDDPNAEPIPPGSESPIMPTVKLLSTGLGLVAQERERQITGEGYGPAHDAEHEPDALALAAACYAMPADLREFAQVWETRPEAPLLWPFDGGWKPTPDDRLRELVKAGAMLVAEIDRLLAEDATDAEAIMQIARGFPKPPGSPSPAGRP